MIKLTALPQFARNTKRFKEIASVLIKYGFAHWIREHDPDFIKSLFLGHEGQTLANLKPEVRIRMALTELGPTFIKLGQIMSTRADLVGPTLAKELELLQSHTPADAPDKVRKIFLEDIEKTPEACFESFEGNAFASASIGQVHNARLADGDVVVKIQHPGIRSVIKNDLDILATLAGLAEKYDPDIRLYQPKAVVAEFRRNLLRELDFCREERNLRHFARNFAKRPGITIPKSYPELSAGRVLTMERLKGTSLAEKEKLRALGVDTGKLARTGAEIYMEMIFDHGLYHADPHPGNIWVLEDGNIGLLDCGMVARLDRQTREKIEDMLLAAVSRDELSLTDSILRLGTAPISIDRDALRMDLVDFLDDYVGESLNDLNLTGMLTSITEIIRSHHIMLPSNISMLLRVLIMLEGTSRELNRDFNIMEIIKPHVSRTFKTRFAPKRLLNKIQRSYKDWERLFQILPQDSAEILQRIRSGTFDINLHHRRLDHIANRMIHGLVVASTFLGSSIILAGKIPPLIKGVSVLGLAGCIIAMVMGFRLFTSIKKSSSEE